MSNERHVIKGTVLYCAGLASAAFAVTILMGFGFLRIQPSALETEEWHVTHDGARKLQITTTDPEFVILLERMEDGRIGLINILRGVWGSVFEFRRVGEFGGGSEITYSGGDCLQGKSHFWIDSDCDGRFDETIDQGSKSVEVRMASGWVRAVKVEGRIARTDRGLVTFDASSGDWVPCKDSGGSASSKAVDGEKD